MTPIAIQFSRFSAFYSPLIATEAGGFLKEEGLVPDMSVSPPGVSAIEALLQDQAQVIQSAPSQGLGDLARGARPRAVHFAQINAMDGFFLAAREPDSDFTWTKLAGKQVLVDHGGQPLAMFKYACLKEGLDFQAIEAVDAGSTPEMIAAFRAGRGDYIHLQGPAPQALAQEGLAQVVAALGPSIGTCAFSSLASTREWLETDMAAAFLRAYRKARAWINETPAAEIAAAERHHFPDVAPEVLTETIAAYQNLGCWAPGVEITRAAFEVTCDVFRNVGRPIAEGAYEAVVAPPPA